MTVAELSDKLSFSPVIVPFPHREIEGAYCGDLLSWVMGRAKSGDLWITMMTNVNIIAVASLADVACILLVEGTRLPQEVLEIADEKGINILSTELPAYEAAVEVSGLLS